jgi:hypothetical protein
MDTEKPRASGTLKCPLWQKPMKLVCHTCALWVHVRGKHPQSEEMVDHWNCALAWMPMLMIENSQQQRATGAAVESFRNEVVSANQSQRVQWEALVNGGRNAIDYSSK